MEHARPTAKITLNQRCYELEDKMNREHLAESIKRALQITIFCMIAYTLFGISSLEIINTYEKVSLFHNLWPRFVFVAIPFFLSGVYLSEAKVSDQTKLKVWSLAFSMINAISASILVWPIATRSPDILIYFTSINNLIFIACAIYVVFPKKIMIFYFASYSIFFFVPIIYLAHQDEIVFATVVNDIAVYSLTGMILSIFVEKNLRAYLYEKLRREEASFQFIDEDLQAVIVKGRELSSLEKPQKCFVLVLDVRGYTEFLKAIDSESVAVLNFVKNLNRLIRETIKKYGGKVHKTAGDGFLCYFTDSTNLNDLYFLTDEDEKVTERRRNYQFRSITLAFHEIAREFNNMVRVFKKADLSICGGLDFGDVHFSILGNDARREYDIVSLIIARAQRLEQYSKVLRSRFGEESFLIISQEAANYHNPSLGNIQLGTFKITNSNPIRSFPDIPSVYFLKETKQKEVTPLKLVI